MQRKIDQHHSCDIWYDRYINSLTHHKVKTSDIYSPALQQSTLLSKELLQLKRSHMDMRETSVVDGAWKTEHTPPSSPETSSPLPCSLGSSKVVKSLVQLSSSCLLQLSSSSSNTFGSNRRLRDSWQITCDFRTDINVLLIVHVMSAAVYQE